ncbi:threonine ammonia-lyase [Aestuariispira insulae]|uniref:L-threonine ammonia-lyase n=1 Tax=Aestuariispira insulae TaxID=1461337 RepID=A0A3D9HVK5_9PROT|nr:threonine/serine dehydratase [Aestuariispira insulae]RED53459.1 L-threonine ammonia-lyase [Aestuariispira insulae]
MNFFSPTAEARPQFSDILQAAERIKGKAVRTPLLESPILNEQLGARVLFKPENLQRTGSFKYRGATNTIQALSDEQRRNGVTAFSSGNHAQGVAAAAKEAGIPATIVMPKDAPSIKIRNTRAYGADIILYDRYTEDREAIGQRVSEETGATLIKPYDASLTITGQGTIGLEIAEQAAEMSLQPDIILAPCGGGGLMSGIALASEELLPKTELYAVEPAGFDDTVRSLASGTRETNSAGARSFCDALLSPSPGEITFPINQKLLKGAVSVTDEEVTEAVKLAFGQMKLVVEPGGAVGLAAVLAGKIDIRQKTIIVVLSGGNVDAELFRTILAA